MWIWIEIVSESILPHLDAIWKVWRESRNFDFDSMCEYFPSETCKSWLQLTQECESRFNKFLNQLCSVVLAPSAHRRKIYKPNKCLRSHVHIFTLQRFSPISARSSLVKSTTGDLETLFAGGQIPPPCREPRGHHLSSPTGLNSLADVFMQIPCTRGLRASSLGRPCLSRNN